MSLNTNHSKLPTSSSYLTYKRLSTIIIFLAQDVGEIIRSLDPSKTHGYDNLSIYMFKLWANAICKPLEMIFNQALISGSFPSD